jgi:hypothetical protein
MMGMIANMDTRDMVQAGLMTAALGAGLVYVAFRVAG